MLTAEIVMSGATPALPEAAVEELAAQPDEPAPALHERLELVATAALRDFVVRRGTGRSVIAGYPWFLDWGRDTLIFVRGMIAAGMTSEAADILAEFARFERHGTLPNMIRGSDHSNRDTSDAPLWFSVACSDLAAIPGGPGNAFLGTDCGGRTITDVLRSIAQSYMSGTSNGIRMDVESGLVFSPSHFTWMDTNFPAGTPRQGYPIEIQALWHAALAFLAKLEPDGRWNGLAHLVRGSISGLFSRQSYLSDCLHAQPGQPARAATPDDALRPNQLLAITLGAIDDDALRRNILAACEELLVPGAIRTLADRPTTYPFPIEDRGHMLNDPHRPYWGSYKGDEDTRRKPAYHNGTAWTWIFPSYSEALYMTYGRQALDRALSVLFSSTELINRDCVGHVPEIADGDTPHLPRGCGAQAWGASELCRVLALLAPPRKVVDFHPASY